MALRDLSVRSKLALTFGTACLATFGLGGTLLSHEAGKALGDEILRRLEVQSRAYALALDAHLLTLERRTEDFASDGFVRDHVEAIALATPGEEGEESAADALRAELRTHLLVNKLPLESAFQDLTILSKRGEVLLAAHGVAPDVHLARLARCGHSGTHVSDFLPAASDGEHPLLAVCVPLSSRRDGSSLGRLIAWIHPGVWVVDGLRGKQLADPEAASATSVHLVDPAGARLFVRDELISASGPASDSELLLSGFGLAFERSSGARSQLEDVGPDRETRMRSFPLGASGWLVEVVSTNAEAFAALAGLQGRFFGLGAVLAALALALFLLPMRFHTRPLLKLADAARKVEAGDLSTRVEVKTDDEFGELGRSFNAMAAAVEDQAFLQERTARDLRERQQELGFERDRLRAVINSLRDGLVVLDADGTPLIHNAAARPILKQLRERGDSMLPHHRCEEAGSNGSACSECLFDPLRGARSCQVEIDGGVFEVHATRLSPQSNGPAGRVLVSLDLSDRIAQDERQIHQERLAVLGEVAAVMAHELNNPLAAISMYNQMLAAEVGESSELAASTTVIQRNVETCKRAIRELLDYATDTTPEVQEVDVHATLEDVAAFVRPLCDRAGVQLELAFGPDEMRTSGDEVQIRQLFVNLVVNAIQAFDGPDGPDGPEGRGDNGRHIRLETAADDGHAVILVTDDGPGVPDAVRDQIFRPFFTTKERGSGTGLGLPTSRRMAEMHGGRLELLEASDQGSVFRVRLPLCVEHVT